MDPEKTNLDSELLNSLLEGLVSALSAAATMQYCRDVYTYLGQLQEKNPAASLDNSHVIDLNETKNEDTPALLHLKYALLLGHIAEIRECLGPAYAKSSRNVMERLKRLITSARKHILTVRDLLDRENLEKE